ncbi:MAG: hypothetical protein M3N95_14300 [Actinomycetota bacterium]|nr:hypothetical protein [Actinomycetota bacterium]
MSRALTRVSEELRIDLPLPADDFAAVLLALSNGLAGESEIDPEGIPDDLPGRVLMLIAGEPSSPRVSPRRTPRVRPRRTRTPAPMLPAG